MMRITEKATDFSRDILDAGMEATMLAVEASAVIAYRTGWMCGFFPMGKDEMHRMFSEKPPAFAASAMAAGFTAIGGHRPDQVMAAALHPLRVETNRNLRRFGGEDTQDI